MVPRGVRVPVRRAQTGERGHERDAAAVGHALGERADFRRVVDDADPVAQPLHGRAGHEDRAFHGVHGARSGAGVELPRHGREQSLDRIRQRCAEVDEHERPGAVGVLRHARLEAGLPEERGLLIAGDAAHGNGESGSRIRVGDPEAATARAHFRQAALRHAERLAELARPGQLTDVVEQRAARVRRVGGVHPTAGEPVQDPRVDRAEREVRPGLDAAFPQQPGELRGREVRVEHEPGAPSNERLQARLAVRVAVGGGSAVLPDDGAVHRSPGRAAPHDDRLTLVRDADARHGLARGRGRRGDLRKRGEGRGPDLLGIVLDPTRLRKVLGELALRAAQDLTVLVDRQRPGAGGPRVDAEDDRHQPPVSAGTSTAAAGVSLASSRAMR